MLIRTNRRGVKAILRYSIQRLLAAIPVVAIVALIIFSLLFLAPGDPAALLAGDSATPKMIEELRVRLGLDQSYFVQLRIWVLSIFRGDFGVSIFSGTPVLELVYDRIEATAALSVVTTVFAVFFGVSLGMIAAWRAGGFVDRAVLVLSAVFFSFPSFVIAYILILLFAMQMQLLPVQGYVSFQDDFWGFWVKIILPCITLGLPFLALLARITRTTVIEVKREDFVRTAVAKGLPTNQILMPHVMKNAAIPIVTMVGLGVSHLISGVVVVETVFAIPGIGRLVVEAILQRDYPVIQCVTLLSSFVYIVVNMVVDISYSFFDPRIKR